MSSLGLTKTTRVDRVLHHDITAMALQHAHSILGERQRRFHAAQLRVSAAPAAKLPYSQISHRPSPQNCLVYVPAWQ